MREFSDMGKNNGNPDLACKNLQDSTCYGFEMRDAATLYVVLRQHFTHITVYYSL